MEFDKKCRVSLSPNTVLPPIPPSLKLEKSSKGKPRRRRDELLIIEDNDFMEIRFSRFRSASCKNESLRTLELGGGAEVRRGSVYQTSGEVRSIKKLGTEDVRSKIEISRTGDKHFCVDSPRSSPLNRYQINFNGDQRALDDFGRTKSVTGCSVVKLSMHEEEPVGDPHIAVAGPELDAKGLCRVLHKSVSAKVELQQSPRQSSGDSPRASPKSRFSPIRKIMDPFMKSRSHKSPLGYGLGFSHDKRAAETLLPEISDKAAHSLDLDSVSVEIDCCGLAKACSPTHLHGCLKLKKINGVPVFEFSLKSPEDIFLARTWKNKNANSWVYTFHANFNRKHSNASARGTKVCDDRDATIVGQMHVSSYSGHGEDDIGDTLTTEFVLYDTSRLSEGSVRSSADENLASHEKLSPTLKHASDFSLLDSTSYLHLHPNLEVAAIVIQVPSVKTESLKHGNAEKIKETRSIEVKRGSQVPSTSSYPKINVVASTGNHSLPEAECQGPSPLLTRWRSGGGCECGGWDMTCPITVFNDGADIRKPSHLPLVAKNIPTELFVQGVKEDMPAFTMKKVEEGHYSVDFHARLSALQAFSICIAMLHSSEASPTFTPSTQASILKTFLDDEVKFLIESVADVSKKTTVKKVTPTTKETSPFTFNPPFSPVSRA